MLARPSEKWWRRLRQGGPELLVEPPGSRTPPGPESPPGPGPRPAPGPRRAADPGQIDGRGEADDRSAPDEPWSADALLRATLADVLVLDVPTSAVAGRERPATPVRHASDPRRAWALEHSSRLPVVFAHAVLETVRQQAMGKAHGAVERLQAAAELLESADLAAIDPGQAADVATLVLAYHADELRLAGKHLEAELLLRKARRRSDRAKRAGEARARLLEIEADLACTIGEPGRALRLLDEAEPLLADCPIPGRRATLLLRRARADLARRRPDKALPSLLLAVENLPADRSFRLRLEIGHTLTMTFLSLRRNAEAAAALHEVSHLYGSLYADPRLQSQKWWMEGHLAMAGDTPEELERAVQCFRKALDPFIEHGQTRDAFRSFADWTVAASKLGVLGEQRREMRRVFARLLDMPGVLDLGRLELQRWLERADALGIEVPSLARLHQRIEASATWRH